MKIIFGPFDFDFDFALIICHYFCHLQNKVALSVLTSGRVDFMGEKIIVWTASKYPPKIRKSYIYVSTLIFYLFCLPNNFWGDGLSD